jgi:hypothetical protein
MIKAFEYNSFLNKSLNESLIQYKNEDIVCVDIQDQYVPSFKFKISEFGDFINQNAFDNRIILLYNGEDLAITDEDSYKKWLISECGVEEEAIDNITFFEKNYGFFRVCIDEGILDDDLAIIGRYMYQRDINDSRFLDENDITNIRELFAQYNGRTEALEKFIEIAIEDEDPFIIPELLEFLDSQNLNNIQLTGGHRGECLAEVQLAIKILGISFKPIIEFQY